MSKMPYRERRSQATRARLTFRVRVGVALCHLLSGEMVAILELVLGHPVPDRLRLGRLDDRDGPLEQSARVWSGKSQEQTRTRARPDRCAYCWRCSAAAGTQGSAGCTPARSQTSSDRVQTRSSRPWVRCSSTSPSSLHKSRTVSRLACGNGSGNRNAPDASTTCQARFGVFFAFKKT